MKRILITGENSYIGTSFKSYISGNFEGYQIDELDVKDDNWRNISFSNYDVVFHVAGIAHVSTNPKLEDLYYKVNRDLAIDVAIKAKEDKVKQFIFMSTMIVFGRPKNGIVTKDTKPNPENFYGRSKLEAEEGLRELESKDFLVSILRPPMIYGPGSKGNYPKLAKLARFTPIFPNFTNKRSMLYIENLSMFIKHTIDNQLTGYFYPQNKDYVQTSRLVKEIAIKNGHKVFFTKVFNPLIKIMTKINFVNKVFGNLYYEMNDCKNLELVQFEESILKTEAK